MKEFYEKAIEDAKSWIKVRSTEELLTAEFFNEVYSQTKLTAPSLNKDNASVKMNSQIMTFENVPSGIRFSPGEKMDYVSFGFPIEGDVSLFNERVKYMIQNNSKIFSVINKVFYIKEFSEIPLINNDSAIEAVKSSAKQKVNNVIDSLETLKEEIESFNKERLTDEIKLMVKEEVEKRKQKDNTLEKLKLF